VDSNPTTPAAAPAAGRGRGPAWVFIALAVVVAAIGGILAPLDFMPSALSAVRPLQVADAVATVLLGAALFSRRPDAWSTQRVLGAAVALFALGALMEVTTPLVILFGWRPVAPGLGSDLPIWLAYAYLILSPALAVAATALLWLGIRRSRRRPSVHNHRPLAVVLWLSAVGLATGTLGSTLPFLDLATSPGSSLLAIANLTLDAGSLIALTALTVTAMAGARANEQPTTAWRLVAASGLVIIIGRWLAPMLSWIFEPQRLLLLAVVPHGIRLTSTLLLLSAFALGLPSAEVEHAGDERALGPLDDATPPAATQP
jgi:hypothetical protein